MPVDFSKPVQVESRDGWVDVVNVTVSKRVPEWAAMAWHEEDGNVRCFVYHNSAPEIRNAPATKIVPFDFETFPRGVVYVRVKQDNTMCLVVEIDTLGAISGESNGYETWRELLENYEHSTDLGKTWLPCGRVTEEG